MKVIIPRVAKANPARLARTRTDTVMAIETVIEFSILVINDALSRAFAILMKKLPPGRITGGNWFIAAVVLVPMMNIR